MSCQICTESFNKSSNSRVTCSHCSETCCKSCMRTYLLSYDDEAKCMFCKNEHDLIFLASNLNKTWVHGPYKIHREKILLDKQIAQLPDTQDKARRTKLSREHEKEMQNINLQKKELMKKIKSLNDSLRFHNEQMSNLLHSEPGKTNSFTYKCPHPDCNGFLDNKWICGSCESKVCKDCMEIITDDHVCNPDKVETIKLIKKDTKPCPGCGEFIHKIHGCDQMWCPTCKVAFSWKTGQIESGNIHNPEYYRWMRENNEVIPRARNNNECGQIPDASFMLTSIRTIWKPKQTNRHNMEDDIHIHILYNCHRLINHIGMIENTYRREVLLKDRKLEDLRVKYLLNEITKEDWMVKLQTQDKAFKKLTDNLNIWRLLRDTSLPLLWYTVEQFHETSDLKIIEKRLVDNVFPKLEKIRNFCNESFIRIGKLYGSTVDVITPVWSNMSYAMYKRSIYAEDIQ